MKTLLLVLTVISFAFGSTLFALSEANRLAGTNLQPDQVRKNLGSPVYVPSGIGSPWFYPHGRPSHFPRPFGFNIIFPTENGDAVSFNTSRVSPAFRDKPSDAADSQIDDGPRFDILDLPPVHQDTGHEQISDHMEGDGGGDSKFVPQSPFFKRPNKIPGVINSDDRDSEGNSGPTYVLPEYHQPLEYPNSVPSKGGHFEALGFRRIGSNSLFYNKSPQEPESTIIINNEPRRFIPTKTSRPRDFSQVKVK